MRRRNKRAYLSIPGLIAQKDRKKQMACLTTPGRPIHSSVHLELRFQRANFYFCRRHVSLLWFLWCYDSYLREKNARTQREKNKNFVSRFTFCAHARVHGVLCGRARKKSHVSKSHLNEHKYRSLLRILLLILLLRRRRRRRRRR